MLKWYLKLIYKKKGDDQHWPDYFSSIIISFLKIDAKWKRCKKDAKKRCKKDAKKKMQRKDAKKRKIINFEQI